MLTVITAATSQDLASLAQVKTALGITDSEGDNSLPPLISAASAAIARECNRVLVRETVEETLPLQWPGMLLLARYPVSSIVQITENGIEAAPSDYVVDSFTGIVERRRSDWPRGRLVVRYVAGYAPEEMPLDIVQALVLLVAHFRSANARDPLLRAEETTDIERLEYFVPTDGALPGPVLALLAPHRKLAGA